MTAVRVRAELDESGLTKTLELLRAQHDVAAVTATADGFEVELAGYALDATEARVIELLRIAEAEVGAAPGSLVAAHDGDASPGGFN